MIDEIGRQLFQSVQTFDSRAKVRFEVHQLVNHNEGGRVEFHAVFGDARNIIANLKRWGPLTKIEFAPQKKR